MGIPTPAIQQGLVPRVSQFESRLCAPRCSIIGMADGKVGALNLHYCVKLHETELQYKLQYKIACKNLTLQ
jgi:hypothetical protein